MSHQIVVEGVSKRFRLQQDRANSLKELITRRNRNTDVDDYWALNDVSLEIPEGSMYALVGHNGSGKSTLLRCIAGIYRPDAGRVRVNGRISTLLELGAGFHPDLSGRENVYLNATILGLTKKEIDRAFDDIVSFAGVEKFIDSPVKVYSSGMYVRLGFSVAVHVRPEILIIDEVIAVGDEAFQRQCFDHLYSLRKDGVTIVVVTHGMATVQTMCDSAAWLDHGVLQMTGPGPKVAAAYLRHVNEAEAAAAPKIDLTLHPESGSSADADSTAGDAPAPRSSITDQGVHWGSGEIRITSVEFLDDKGRVSEAVETGRPMKVRIGYETDETFESPTFGIAILNDGGIHVTGTNTRLSMSNTGTISGRGHVEYSTDRLPLTPGSYTISVAVEDQWSQRTFDRYDEAFHLYVRQSGEKVVHGLVDIGGAWFVEPGRG